MWPLLPSNPLVSVLTSISKGCCHTLHSFTSKLFSIIELSIFLYQTIDLATSQGQPVTSSGPSPICSSLIYDPYRRYEPWRLITYTLVHSGYLHIATNIIVQLLLGLPLEIVHGPLRIGVIYVAGGLSGSLLTSITDPEQFLAGASGGVYALMLAHLPTLIMNWREMKTFFEWIVSTTVLSIGLVDFVVSIIQRYTGGGNGSIGYSAHIAGGVAGILIGMNVLRNFHHKRWEGYLRMVCFLLWVVSLVLCILANALFVGHFPLPNRDSIGDCVYYDVNYPFLQQRKHRMMMPTNT